MKDKVLHKLKKDIEKHGYVLMCKKIALPYGNLYRVAKQKGTCTMKTWDKIESYYRR